MKKGFFAAFLCALIMVLLPAAVYAMDGTGTEDNPYQISSADDLEEFRDIVNDDETGACAELTANIVLNDDVLNSDGSLNEEKASTFEEWTPIGSESNRYTGTFDGTGHTISGIYINTSENYQGLFGCIGDINKSGTGTVKNLGIEKSRIKGGNNVGGIAGYSIGSIEDCYNTGSVSGGNNVGGIWGQNISGMIRNCYNTGSISGGSNVGGIVGNSSDVSGISGGGVTGCHNDGTVIGSGSNIGGILGNGARNSAISKCYNTGSVSSSGKGPVAGIAGGIVFGTSNCYNTGTISGEEAYGITAGNLSGVWNSYNIGKVDGHAILGGQEADQAKNNYYLKGSATLEVDEEKEKAEEKTFEEFASGEVAYLFMEKGNSDAVKAEWGQRIGDDFPIITDDEDLRVYKVTFMVNGREYAVAYGNSYGVLVMPDAPLLSGGGFKYWVDEDGEKFTKDSSVKKNMTVTADKNPRYELTEGSALRFETNGGTEIKTVYAEKGDVIDLSGYVTEKKGYIFDGWYTGNDFEEKVDEIEIDGGMTVYAKWTKDESGESGESGESVTSAQTFTDVSIFDWYNEGVMYVSENGIMNGVGGNKFEPGTELKREMLATILWNMEGKPEPKDIAPFLDVMSGEYYSKAIAWAGENGIISGYGSEYGVGEAVTREDFAAILYRYAEYKGYDTTQGGMAVREFADYEEISEYAKTPVAWAVNTGIISGMCNGSVSPKTTTSRGQAAVMLMNFCKNVK